MYVKKLIVLVFANKTLHNILLENFWGIRGASAPSTPHPRAAHPVKTKHNNLQGKRQRIMRIEYDRRHRASGKYYLCIYF